MGLLDSLPTVPSTSASGQWGLPSAPAQSGAGTPQWGLPSVGPHAIVRAPAVREMQEAIMQLAQDMSTHNAFNAFLSTRNEVSIDPNVMLAVGQIGQHGGRGTWTADGAWGPNTDKGLHEALQTAIALDKLATQMGREGYDIETLKSLIPENHGVANAETAAKLTAELTKLSAFYMTMARFVEHRYGNKLNEDAAIVRYDTGALTQNEEEYLKAHEDDAVATLQDGSLVRLRDLRSAETLEALFHRLYPNATNHIDAKTQAASLLSLLQPLGGGAQ